MGWQIDEANRGRGEDGALTIWLGRGEDEAAEARVLVAWTNGWASVLVLECSDQSAEDWLLTVDGERAVLALWWRAAA